MGRTPLMLASKHKKIQTVQLLKEVNNQKIEGKGILTLLVSLGSINIIQYLIDNGADP